MHLFIRIPLLFIVISFIACADPEVTVKLGKVRGKTKKVNNAYVDEYLGIPFAKPPIGALRFVKPQELTTKWSKPFAADKLPAMCSQVISVPTSEDCLYLNIWAPTNRTKNFTLPVMFWIHGGGLASGSGISNNGAIFSTYNQVIVVTINYRLNAFGFLFGNNDAIPGNVGLYDQVIAMKWVYENIQGFGGNPNLITIFGVSAGGWSVSLHLMSTVSRPYFKQAIMMSGVEMDYLGVEPKDSALKKAKALANAVGCKIDGDPASLPPAVVECLRSKDVKSILTALTNQTVKTAGLTLPLSNFFTFYPVFGEAFIPKTPREMWKEKQFKTNSSLLFGTVFNEFVFHHVLRPPTKPSELMKQGLYSYIQPQFLTKEQIEHLIKIYYLGVDEIKNRNDALQISTQLFDDVILHCPSEAFAEAFTSIASNSAFQYIFNYKSKKDNPKCDPRYPCHGSDLPFTFGAVTSLPDDLTPALIWMKVLGDFAKSGNSYWPKYYRISDKHLVPVYYEFKGNAEPSNTQIGFRHFRCQTWKSMVLK